MTACVNKHSKRVAAVISASLVGALSLGIAVPAFAATDTEVEPAEPSTVFASATFTWNVEPDEDGDLTVSGTLKSFEEKLAGKPFARCNSGYLVNLAQVMGVQQNTVQVGPYELQISRPKKKAFMEALTDYIGGGGE